MNWIKKNLFGILIIIAGLVYITYGLATLEKSGKSVIEIIGAGAIATLVGWVINVLWGKIGIKEELNSQEFISTLNEKAKIIDEITNDIGKLFIYCDKKNELSWQRRKVSILRKVGLTINDYETKYYDKTDKEIMAAIKKANTSYYEDYQFDSLLSDVRSNQDGKKTRVDLKTYQRKVSARKLLTSTLSGVIFGYFVLSMVDGIVWANVIWNTLQIVIFNLMGFFQYLMNRSFVSLDMRNQIIDDTNTLYDFRNSLTQHPEWYIENINEKEKINNANKL